MSAEVDSGTGRAAELRREFDRSFAAAVAVTLPETVDFIGLSLAGTRHAIRTADIAGLYSDIAVTPVPSPVAELVGLAGLRGELIPVYDLAALLGFPPAPGRWLAVDATRSLALCFAAFDDHFRVEKSAIVAQPSSATRHVGHIVRQGRSSAPIIDLASLVETLKLRVASLPKEH